MKSNTPSASYSPSNIQELGYSITTSFYWKYCEKHKFIPQYSYAIDIKKSPFIYVLNHLQLVVAMAPNADKKPLRIIFKSFSVSNSNGFKRRKETSENVMPVIVFYALKLVKII